MKTRILVVVVALGLAAGLAALCAGCGQDSQTSAAKYHCPMHPTVISDKPGDCPICGMKLVPMEGEEKVAAAAEKYHCPMHPTIVSDEPGDCPICFMKLVPMEEEATEGGPSSTMPGLAVVSITPQSRQVMGLELGTVERRVLSREVRTSARIDADETRLHHVTVKIDGWVNELFASVTGQEVREGEPLLTVYSPDLVSAQREYLTAVETRDKMAASGDPATRRGGEDLVSAARRRLELWDISSSQLDRLERTREVEKYLTLFSPMGGVIIERNILAGHRVMAGEVLMTVADLTHVWGDADIYQSDLPYVRVGMPLEMSLPYWPNKTFRGKVIFLTPTIDPETRTMRARLEIPNPERLLKPGMYGDASLYYAIGEKLAVPAAAVMFSGRHTYAFRDIGDGHLVPTMLTVGARADGWYEVIDGLNEGDRIVVSANFLVDSESSLKAALEAITGGGTPPPADEHKGHQR